MKFVDHEYGEKSTHFKKMIVACLIFIAANALDYITTVTGIITDKYKEGNTIIQYYINLFGLYEGILVYKLIICGFIMFGLLIFSYKYKREARKYKPENFLYTGSVIMLIASVIWLN